MMAEANGPPERDTKDFKFQQLCRVRVTDTPSTLPQNRSSLIAASSKYAVTFVGVQKGFKVLRTSDFVVFDQRHSSDRLKHIITDFPVLADVNIGYQVTHIQLSADELTLAVAITRPEHAVVYLYDVCNFAAQVSGTVAASHMIVGEGNQQLNDLSWNPADPNLLIICYCTGRLDVYVGKDRKSSLSSARAKCVCWSPRGKQLVVGRDDGTLVQYDPDLNEKRKWDCPNILTTASEAFDVVWLSTYSFLVAYIAHGADSGEQPSVVLINGAKDAPATYVNFEDMCFGTGEERERKYYFNFVQKWDMVLAASSNSAEIGIVGKHLDNKSTLERWNLDDSARAECPLTDDYADTYPMGFAVDFSSQTPIPLGDEKTHPPSPLMLILSTEGLILPYHMMYMHQSAPAICVPAQALPAAATRQATGVPATPSSQQGVVKNLFGSGTTQPISKPAATGFAFTAASLAGSSTTKSGASSPFSFAAPTSAETGTIPKFGAGLSLAGSTTQSGSAAGFSLATGTGVPAAKSDQSEPKPPLNTGFGSTALAGSTNKSGANAGFSVTPSFGAPTTAGGSFSFSTSTNGASGFGAKNSIATDAVGFKTTINSAASSTPGFTFAAKVTEPGPQTSGLSFKPATTSKTPTPLFGQSSQSQAPTPTFGLSAQKTATATTTAAAPVLPAFGKAPTASVANASASGIGSTTAAVSKPVPSFTGQSSAFTGMPSAAIGRPLPKSDSQTSDLGQSGTFVPKSPTQAPPPPAYPASGIAPQSPKFAPPPQYPSDAPQYTGDTQDGRQEQGETTDEVDKQFSKSILDEIEHFGKELADFRHKAKRTDYIVGTKDDMKRLKQQTQEMDNFCTEIKTTVQEENKEVQDQKALVLDMFSMVEECRLRQHMNTDHKYLHLLKSRALDPGSAEKLQQLQLQYQVLDQGLRDVDLILDTQWEEYQNRKKNRTNRVQNPTNDAVYRVVKSNSNLITAQKNKLKELEERLKQLKLYNKTSAWNNTTSSFSSGDTTTELSNLADTLLSGNPVQSKNDPPVKEERRVDRNRLERLREHLCRRNVSVVRSTKPGNLSVLKIPDSQLERSVFRNSQQQLSDLEGVQRNAGEFVGMFRRTTAAPNTDGQRDNRTSSPQTNSRQTVTSQNERNTRDQVKDKTEKDGKMSKFFNKIIEKGAEKIDQLFPPKSQAKLTVTSNQGLGAKVKEPTQQVPQNATIPKTIQTMFPGTQDGQSHLTRVKEINGIKFEDITPSGSENDVGDTEEDDEYDEDSSESNDQGFGLEYSLTSTAVSGDTITSTPITIKGTSKPFTQDSSRLPATMTTSTPVGRKLFGTEDTKPAAGFNFGAASASVEAKTKSESKPFNFATTATAATTFGSQSESSKPQTGFNFAVTGTPTFGSKAETQSATSKVDQTLPKSSAEGKPAPGQITGLFGKPKPTATEAVTSETKPETTVTSAKPAVPFGQPTTLTTSSGLFGQNKTTSAPTPAFGQPTAVTASQGLFGQPKDTGSSVIGQPSDAVTSTSDLGETTPQADSSLGTASGGLFGQPASVSKPPEGLFGQSTTLGAGLFGQSVSSSAGSTNLFGQGSTTATATSDDQSSSVTTTTTSSGIFGQKTDSATTEGASGQTSASAASTGLFGKPAGTTAVSAFGHTSTSSEGQTASSSGLFGKTATTSGTSLFGQTATTSGTSLFGQTATTSGTGLFGQSATTSGSSLFGQTTTTSGGSLFGKSTTTSGSSPFGQPATTSSVSSSFGQAATTSAGTGLFGQTSSTTTASTGLFGQATTTASSGGLFGQTPSSGSSSSGGLFGQQGGSLFGQTSTSGTGGLFSGQTATSSGGVFGQSTTSTSGGLFGQSTTSGGGGLFGSAGGSGFGTATSGPGFGFGQTATSGFGQPAFGQTSGFGQSSSSSSPFGQSSTDTTSGGNGGMFSGLGGKPSAEKANTNVFGTAQPFGSSQANTQGLFGSGTSQAFGGGTSTGGGFSSGGGFTGGTGVAATGFGAAKQTGTGGFGAAPSFGSAPAFGGTPAFGSSPAFGSPPAFGSGGTQGGFAGAPTFGSPAGSTFGSVAQGGGGESAGFAGFAAAGSPTFGALAQSTDAPTFGSMGQSPNAGGFGGNSGNAFGSSPSFTGYRG
ncbi:nuclear pore complex protein Nup214-like isoform X2 [Mercenaria mercenaria]|uniref:nuclear pore complex protein Nup214-like isoform X2 n=1 Tax=Mercenaria mercenaria TaxID=6596 RepID=UPI00234F7A48|nr:nuclear pore complex protein Nup214-like isoform X2 [Mercenaria mercenaria]